MKSQLQIVRPDFHQFLPEYISLALCGFLFYSRSFDFWIPALYNRFTFPALGTGLTFLIDTRITSRNYLNFSSLLESLRR